jgi:hypothetical protein
MKKVLHLTLKKKWFDMIVSGEKKEEYREVKEYWAKRFVKAINYELGFRQLNASFELKDFDIVRFKNGYAKDAPVMDIECLGIELKEGQKDWGAEPGVKYFTIRLGKKNSINEP